MRVVRSSTSLGKRDKDKDKSKDKDKDKERSSRHARATQLR
jgi:hypothetical protein